MESYRSTLTKCVSTSTIGIVFLGTPLRGSEETTWGITMANCASALGAGSDKKLLETLQPDSERLDNLLDDFCKIVRLQGIDVTCFYETKMMEKLLKKALV